MDINFVGFIFSVIGIIATAHALFERLFKYSLFQVFIDITPVFLRGFGQNELSVWLDSRVTKDNIYHAWDAFLLYLVLVSFTLILMVAFWVFLILKIFSIYTIPIYLLILLLIVNIAANFQSAVNQTAIKFKVKYPELQNMDEIKRRMFSEMGLMFKIIFKFFFLDFIIGPYNSLKILLLIILVIMLYGPAWIIRMFQKKKLNLAYAEHRTNYFIGYAFTFLLVGVIISTFF